MIWKPLFFCFRVNGSWEQNTWLWHFKWLWLGLRRHALNIPVLASGYYFCQVFFSQINGWRDGMFDSQKRRQCPKRSIYYNNIRKRLVLLWVKLGFTTFFAGFSLVWVVMETILKFFNIQKPISMYLCEDFGLRFYDI